MMERRDRFGAKRAGEREGEGQWLPLAVDKGGRSGCAQVVHPGRPLPLSGTSRRHSTRASEASERSGAKRSGDLFDCRSQLFSSKDAPYFDFECRFFASRVCVWQMFYNIFEYF